MRPLSKVVWFSPATFHCLCGVEGGGPPGVGFADGSPEKGRGVSQEVVIVTDLRI